MTEPNKEVLDFIGHFYGANPEFAKNLFSRGQCFWFAHILKARFKPANRETAIYYNQVLNHFATRIGDYLYDINGAFPLCSVGWVPWEDHISLDDEDSRRVYRDCIYQLSPEEYEKRLHLLVYSYPWYFID